MSVPRHWQLGFTVAQGGSWCARARSVALLVVAHLVVAHPAFAQVAYVQSTGLFGNPAGTTASSSAFAANPKVGDTIVVLLWTWSQNTAPATTVSDSAGNTYTSNALAIIDQSAWYESAQVFSAPVTSTTAGLKVTVNMPGNDNVSQSRAVALEYSGIGAVDQTNAVTGTAAAASVATTTATSFANELVVSAFGVDNPADDFSSIAPSSGFTTRAFEYQNAGDTAGAGADKIINSTGVQSNTWTVSPSLAGWAAVIATFSPSNRSATCGAVPSTYPITSGPTGSLSLSNGVTVNGNSPTGSGYSVQTSGVLTNATPIFPALSPSSFPSFSSGTSSSGPTVSPGTYSTVSGSVTFTGGGTYYINTLSAGNNANIAFAPGTYYINTLSLTGNGVSVTASGPVTIYLGASFTAGANLQMNAGGAPANFALYLYSNASVTLSNNDVFSGVIYGPGANNSVTTGNNVAITGLIAINGSIGLGNNTSVALSAADQAAIGSLSTCAALATPDHFAISDAGTAVNCQASPVTITAHSPTHTPIATTGTINVSTSTGHGDWSLTTGGGTFIPGAANSGTAVYTYVTADNGAVTLSLKDTFAETVTINVVDGAATQKSGSAIAAEQPPLTFVASGFRITNGANVAAGIGTQIAGKTSTQSLALQAIRTDTTTGACTAAFTSGATVNVSLAYQCNNPATCVAGQTLTITNNGIATNIASNPAGGVTAYTTVPLKFSTPNAEAPFTLDYSDAGQITLDERYVIPLGGGAGSGNIMLGSSLFVVQPYNFTLSNIKCTAYGAATCAPSLAAPGLNPGATSAAGSAFIQAGQPFSATVTATNFGGAATPNFGQEIAPAAVTLTANLAAPAGGDAAALNNAAGFGSFSGGSATGTTFNWPEVGIITLTPSVASYLGSGTVTGTPSGDVGRFIPNGFAVALNTPVFGTGCSAGSFSYLGQPLAYTVAPVITATAQALGGATTRNYTGSFLKLTNSSLTARTYTPTPASPALNTSGLPATGIDPAIADLGTGQATLTFSAGSGLLFSRTSAIAPFSANIALSINVLDSDAAAAPNPVTFGSGTGISFSTGATQYYGRLALRDAVGSELLDLPMPLTTQYYLSTTQGFTTNTADSCTTAPALAFSNYQLNLSSGETCVRDTGHPGSSGQGCSAAAAPSLQYHPVAVAGNFNLMLSAPGAGDAGAVSVTATAPTWLQYNWGSLVNPLGMATFGVFPGPTSRVHQREVY